MANHGLSFGVRMGHSFDSLTLKSETGHGSRTERIYRNIFFSFKRPSGLT